MAISVGRSAYNVFIHCVNIYIYAYDISIYFIYCPRVYTITPTQISYSPFFILSFYRFYFLQGYTCHGQTLDWIDPLVLGGGCHHIHVGICIYFCSNSFAPRDDRIQITTTAQSFFFELRERHALNPQLSIHTLMALSHYDL